MTDLRIDAYDAAAATNQTRAVHRAHSDQYPPGPPIDAWRDGIWATHRARNGFDLLITREDEKVAGIVWGYVGDHGQYWTDLAAGSLSPDVAAAWLGDHFEVVELIVRPAYRRRGVGRQLLAGILERSDRSRALLSVDAVNVPARSLYESMGWEVLGSFTPGKSVMGVVLSHSAVRDRGAEDQ